MNRFFRSALFPLIIIVVLAYLAMNALTGNDEKAVKESYSQLYERVQTDADSIEKVLFTPRKQQITATLTDEDSTKIVVNYPTPDSQIRFERALAKYEVAYDSKGTGSSPWWSLLTAFLPFVILIAFWIFLMNQMQGGGS
ncbi:MAG: ATP-dependent metallopeptidase FtsH/Yme1/Tma family protein, partial [Actinobacteria bacterium]|nr:ATP-dependent metallopeptidase FtsH/Yme1/Tma family protein [Actinomycetota bacterium]